MKTTLSVLMMALVLAGCSTTPALQAPMVPMPTAFKEAATPVTAADGSAWKVAQAAESQPRGQWWLAFNDATLNDLVAQAGEANATLAVAAARVKQARAIAGVANADRSVQVGAGVSGQRARDPVNPAATVKVVWLGAWFDPPREREAAMTLFNQGVEVMAFHTGSTAVMTAAQERGKLAIAYHSDMRKVAPDAQVLAITHQWGNYYTSRAKAVIDGSWKSAALWGGVKEGMIRVDSFGPKVPKQVADEVLARQRDIAAGRLHPFKARGALLDNEGHEVLAAGKTLSDEQILNMNFLVQGVQGKLNQ